MGVEETDNVYRVEVRRDFDVLRGVMGVIR